MERSIPRRHEGAVPRHSYGRRDHSGRPRYGSRGRLKSGAAGRPGRHTRGPALLTLAVVEPTGTRRPIASARAAGRTWVARGPSRLTPRGRSTTWTAPVTGAVRPVPGRPPPSPQPTCPERR